MWHSLGQGMHGVKHPSVSDWLSPALEKLTPGRSHQPWSRRPKGTEEALTGDLQPLSMYVSCQEMCSPTEQMD